jgi:hypothetical protein
MQRGEFDAFLQGSYGNDTNIFGDSDVDIVLRAKTLFYYNIDKLDGTQKAAFKRDHPNDSQYALPQFKQDVTGWLQQKYGNDLDTSGKKALRKKANGYRRDADVLLVAPYKHYSHYWNEQDKTVVEGVLFITSDGTRIVNYPKQHSENMTAKHQASKDKLKPMVRIYKNIRNKLVERKIIRSGAVVGIIPTDTWMIGKIKIYCARINPRKRRKWITSILLAIRSSQVLE